MTLFTFPSQPAIDSCNNLILFTTCNAHNMERESLLLHSSASDLAWTHMYVTYFFDNTSSATAASNKSYKVHLTRVFLKPIQGLKQ